MKKVALLFAVLLSLVSFSGCVSPKVKYVNLQGQDHHGYIKFHLVGSNILITKAAVPETEQGSIADIATGESVAVSKIAVSVVPREQRPALYAIVPKSQWLGTVDTKIHASFYDNSRIIHQLGTKVEDNRIKIIQAIGGAAVAAGAMLAPKTIPKPDPKLTMPVVINPDDFDFDTWVALPRNPAWSFRLIEKPQPEDRDAVPVAEFFEKYDNAGLFNATTVFPISSCRSVKLNIINLSAKVLEETITYLKKEQPQTEAETLKDFNDRIEQSLLELYGSYQLFALQLANPHYVRTVRMPDAGTVITHTVCGADTTTEGSNTATGYELISELMKQAKAVYEAQKKN